MKNFMSPNIGTRGRLIRALMGLALMGSGLWLHETGRWLCFSLVAAGGFCLWEAVRGWCIARACGIKTRI
jgi:hypothetical protein